MRWTSLAGIGLGIAGVAGQLLTGQHLAITHETVVIPDLPASFDGFRLLHMTDLHFRPRTSRCNELLAAADRLCPDLICLGGDYVINARSLPTVQAFLKRLTARWPVVGILGNADYRRDLGRRIHERWSRTLPILVNSAYPLDRDGGKLWIVGVDDPHCGRDKLPLALRDVPSSAPVVLLAHSPDVIHRTLDPRVKLILCGHTHGGQICLPGGYAMYNNTSLPSRFASGRHQIGDTVLYVSRGVGSTRLPIRANCTPEITVFTLTCRREG